jgi:hypothetical protein
MIPILFLMGIESTSLDYARANILFDVGIEMLAKSLKGSEAEANNLMEIIASAAPLPMKSGTKVDLRA